MTKPEEPELNLNTYTAASEFVGKGHPDKVADQIADAILDEIRETYPDAQAGVEVALGADHMMLFGEVDSRLNGGETSRSLSEDWEHRLTAAAYSVLEKINEGMEEKYKPSLVMGLVTQSPQIRDAVLSDEIGAGDQGFCVGYAACETKRLTPIHHELARYIIRRLEDAQRSHVFSFNILPDAKSMVTMQYDCFDGRPLAITQVLVSQSHELTNIGIDGIREELQEYVANVVEEFVDSELSAELDKTNLKKSLPSVKYTINPSGKWTLCGPAYDSGLTGRKLVVDAYGAACKIGGGATSGKNSTKVDRSGAYFARWIAKSLVASGLMYEATVQLGFGIGLPEATSLDISGILSDNARNAGWTLADVKKAVVENFDLHVSELVKFMDSYKGKLMDVAVYGMTDDSCLEDKYPWEQPKKLALQFPMEGMND